MTEKVVAKGETTQSSIAAGRRAPQEWLDRYREATGARHPLQNVWSDLRTAYLNAGDKAA